MSDTLDPVENLLAHLVCAEAGQQQLVRSPLFTGGGMVGEELDAGVALGFQPMAPKLAYAPQIEDPDADDGRVYSFTPDLLLHSIQDLIGRQTEVVLFDVVGQQVKWTGLRKIHKRPRGVWVQKPGADLYEFHFRLIRPNGQNYYAQRVAAIDRHGHAVNVVIAGSHGGGSAGCEGRQMSVAASVIEDCLRPGVFQATVSDSVGLKFPVPAGEHKELFKLRDGPYTGSRRKPILHWVSQHLRRRPKQEPTQVTKHLRGVHQFTVDGLSVTLEAKAA